MHIRVVRIRHVKGRLAQKVVSALAGRSGHRISEA